ncbi:dihydroneopterin aldolase [Sphingomonas sp.]|jgi:dihydroneopterin aldolase|uniref:dihydroneopterin aldolase n=1 Tax=Sphingomonas sp. TaxID=28214 RepID=UPI002E30FBB5|nr:dihydroneopterin aldolase [Sphingomonas sp.]HEX4693870.1 dihydroneopterin aldolase [Sphingomonas sp.]
MAEATYTIRLDSLEVTMGLGIHAHERAAPQRVLISVAMTCAYPAAPHDRIDAVVDYDQVRERIRAIAANGHVMLQEVLCERIAALCLSDRRVVEVTVRSTKPDVYPDAQIGCEIRRSRC